MKRLIDANKLWLSMASDQTVDQYCYPCIERIGKAIKEQPIVDAVPVVRCRVCLKKRICSLYRETNNENGFCAWGVRKK